LSEVAEMTYHDINKTHFITSRDRMKIAAENFELAQERKKDALMEEKGSELERQGQIQTNLNDEREKLLNHMANLKESLKRPDPTPVPKLLGYKIQNHDGIRLTFGYKYGRKEEGEVSIDTTIAGIFQKTGRAQISSMKQSKKKTYIEKGIDFVLSFHSDTIIQFLTMDEFCEMKSAFIGKPCLSHIHGLIREDPITSISKGQGCVKLTVADVEHDIGEPVAIAADKAAIWGFDPGSGSFTWMWFDKSK